LAPKLNTDLPLRCDRTRRQSAFDREQGRVGSKLLQSEWRLPLAGLHLRSGELMPVDKDVCSRKVGATRGNTVALLKVAFDFEIELLCKVPCQIDPCPAQAGPVFQRSLTKVPLESEHIAIFKVNLNESAQDQLNFRSALLDVNGRFLFDDLFDVRFPFCDDFRFHFALMDNLSLLGF